ncbi:MAG: hypothetical protein ACKVWR_00095 [Acidimicrobiales bacterium]
MALSAQTAKTPAVKPDRNPVGLLPFPPGGDLMATHTAAVAATATVGTVTTEGVDTFTLTGVAGYTCVVMASHTAAEPVWITWSLTGSTPADPTVGGADCVPVQPGREHRIRVDDATASVMVKVLAAGAYMSVYLGDV